MQPTTRTDLQTYSIDPAHSRLGFSVRHMGFSRVQGSFEDFEGIVQMKPGDLSTLEANATIQAQSINTNETDRDEHLRSADFFEVEKYPTITFKSTEVRDVTEDTFTLVGEFAMHGVTETLELEGEFLGEGQDPWGNTRVAFEARTRINRKDFGLNWNAALEAGGFLVGDKVNLVIEVQAVLQEEAVEEEEYVEEEETA